MKVTTFVVVQTTVTVGGFLMQSQGSGRLPPEYWQTRADKVRTIADEMFDLQSRETLLKISNDYESLAKRARERAAVDFNKLLTT
jgi:hypothetical protein